MRRIKLTHRKERRTLTPMGRLVVGIGVVLVTAFIFTRLYPFFTLHQPLRGNMLVVEGWLPDYMMPAAVDTFRQGGYEVLVTTGGPLEYGRYLTGYTTYAEASAHTFIQLGIDSLRVHAVPAPDVTRGRTRISAEVLRDWLNTHFPGTETVDIYTYGVHARRSYETFQEALGPDIKTGVIAADNQVYGPDSWWKTSLGVVEMMKEVVAYVILKLTWI